MDLHRLERRFHRLGGRLHQRAMERRADRQKHGALRAGELGELHRPLDRRPGSRHDHLPAAVVVRRLANRAFEIEGACRLGRNLDRRAEVEPEQRRHRALADRDRLLHRLAPEAQQTRGILKAQGARRAQGGIFAERVAGDEGRVARNAKSGLGLERAKRRHARRHQRRLGVGGQRQFGLGALEHELRQVLRERRIDPVEHLARGRKRFGERLAHADRLRPLTRKHQGRLHGKPRRDRGAKTQVPTRCQGNVMSRPRRRGAWQPSRATHEG